MKRKLDVYLRATAFRKGVLGTSKGWFAIWAGLGAARFLQKRLGHGPPVVERWVLRPGETIVVSDTGITRGDFGRLD